MPARAWRLHAGRLLLGLLLVCLAGWLSGRMQAVLLVTGSVYLAWLVFNGFRLYGWLGSGTGQPPESFGIWADIFDRIHKLQKQNLARQQQYESVIQEFQSMSDALPDATVVVDEDGNINWFNHAARRLLGLKDPDDLGQPVTHLLRDPDFADWMAVEGQVQGPFEMTSPANSNIRLSATAVRYRHDQRLLVLRDVTEVHNLERIRRDFVANVSHELRTPLTVLLGYLESIHDQCPGDVRPAVERMQEQARQMQALLNDLLELSRLQSGEQEAEDKAVDVPAVLMQLKEQSEEINQGQHELRFEIEPGLRMTGNAVDLESAFRNLINNAISYTPAGGSITVRWEQRPEGLTFSVADTGIGIPTRDIPRLTERFYRVGSDRSRHSGGTGLGLAIVKHVLNAHDARLLIDSELGNGSIFTCLFPAVRRCGPVSIKD
jgi:two-component system phosphate regulon sensor histidine kinase PhoR